MDKHENIMILSGSPSIINQIKSIKFYEEFLEFLTDNKGFYVEENNLVEHEVADVLDLEDSFKVFLKSQHE